MLETVSSRDELQILVHRRSAQLAHPCQLADIHLLSGIGWVVLIEDRRNVFFGCGLPSDLLALGFGVGHAGFYSAAYHLHQFEHRDEQIVRLVSQ